MAAASLSDRLLFQRVALSKSGMDGIGFDHLRPIKTKHSLISWMISSPAGSKGLVETGGGGVNFGLSGLFALDE